MARFGFCSGTYQSDSVNADAQRSINWYPENVESGDGATAVALYPTPGLKRFASLTGTHVRGMYEFNGRLFVYTDMFYEVFADGTFSQGQNLVPDDGLPVTMAANSAQQLLICGGGQVFLFSLGAGGGTPGQPPPAATTNNIIAVQYYPAQPPIQNIPGHAASLAIWSDTPWPAYTANTTLYLTGLSAYPDLNGQGVALMGVPNNADTTGGAPSHYAITIATPASFATGIAGALLTETGTVSSAPGGNVITNVLPPGAISRVDFLDGYFLALGANSSTVYYSSLENGGAWNALSSATVSEFPENVLAMITTFRELWLFSGKRAIVYYDAGDPLTPIQPIPGAYVEHGINAPWSVARLDNSLFWIGSDERGRNVAWRSQGYTPVRVSTHGVESIWKTYPTLSDGIGYATSKCGHGWWHLHFPAANASWRYDTTTGMWHEVGFLETTGAIGAHRSRSHAYAFEKNLVGDTASGTVYELTGVPYDDTPDAPLNPIKRIRRAPHVINEHEWMFHHRMRLLVEAGLGPMPPLSEGPEGYPGFFLQSPDTHHWDFWVAGDGSFQVYDYGPTTDTFPVFQFVDLAYFPQRAVCYTLNIDNTGYWYLNPVAPPNNLSGFIRRHDMGTLSGMQTSISVQFGRLVADPLAPRPREPRVMLRWSDDGGHTWSNEYLCGAGFGGEFRRRVEWRRLGRSRDRIYEVSTSDAVPWRIVDAYLDVSDPQGQGYKPVQRYAHQIGKMA